jgi:hypothetical protein
MIDKTNFSLRIERLVNEKRIDYIDAIVYYCENNNIEIESAASLLNDKVREMIKLEANNSNLLKESSKFATLPI